MPKRKDTARQRMANALMTHMKGSGNRTHPRQQDRIPICRGHRALTCRKERATNTWTETDGEI